MVLSEEEKKQRNRDNTRNWRLNNPEKYKASAHKYYDEHKGEIGIYMQEYVQTPRGKMLHTINSWKGRGLKGDTDIVYRIYQSTKFCDDCGTELNTPFAGRKKCMDHCHKSGGFRGVVCVRCNNRRR